VYSYYMHNSIHFMRQKGCRYGDCKAYCEKHTECIHCEDAWLFGAMPDKDCFEEADK